MKRVILMWVAFGAAYVALETVWRGYSHPAMLIVGGLCGVLVGAINQVPRFYKLPIICQSLIGAGIVLVVEFFSGCALNLWLGLNIWDYSGQFGNIAGQVCPAYGFLWLLIMPFAIWLEDTARWLFYSWDKLTDRPAPAQPTIPPYTLKSIYGDFFMGR